MECRFCNLIREKEKVIYQDALISLFFDIDPIAKGHALIIPNEHFGDIDEVPRAVLTQVLLCAKQYVAILKQYFAPAGYSVMQNGGAFNDIGHFHLHVFPRYTPEDFGWTYKEEVEDMAKDFASLKDLLQNPLQQAMAAF